MSSGIERTLWSSQLRCGTVELGKKSAVHSVVVCRIRRSSIYARARPPGCTFCTGPARTRHVINVWFTADSFYTHWTVGCCWKLWIWPMVHPHLRDQDCRCMPTCSIHQRVRRAQFPALLWHTRSQLNHQKMKLLRDKKILLVNDRS